MMLGLRVMMLLSLVAVGWCGGGPPTSAQCSSDADCSQGECCVYLPGRYGATSCQLLGRPQQQCRPVDKVANYTVLEPGSGQADVLAHYALCPCALGLTCSHSGSCVQDIPYGSESHPAQTPIRPQ